MTLEGLIVLSICLISGIVRNSVITKIGGGRRMYEFLEGHLMIQMILLMLLIVVQIKLSLKSDGRQATIILWIVGVLMVIQTAQKSIQQEITSYYGGGLSIIVDFLMKAKLYTITLMILGFIHCICRIIVITKQNKRI